MNQTKSSEKLTVLYDGSCPLCRREISHVKGLAERSGENTLCFVDISNVSAECNQLAISTTERTKLLARFHVQRPDGSRLDGAAAFVAMWKQLPGWRWLAKLAQLPGMLSVMEFAYRGFLIVRPQLQKLARRLEPSAKVD